VVVTQVLGSQQLSDAGLVWAGTTPLANDEAKPRSAPRDLPPGRWAFELHAATPIITRIPKERSNVGLLICSLPNSPPYPRVRWVSTCA
jgi:hypothetical protein